MNYRFQGLWCLGCPLFYVTGEFYRFLHQGWAPGALRIFAYKWSLPLPSPRPYYNVDVDPSNPDPILGGGGGKGVREIESQLHISKKKIVNSRHCRQAIVATIV